MRVLIDLQACQTGSRYRGIGRYAMSIVKAMLADPRDHEFFVALNHFLQDSIEPIRSELGQLLPAENIRVWQQPRRTSPHHESDAWRRAAAEVIREDFLRSLQPDVVYVPSVFEGVADEAAVTINKYFDVAPVAVTHHDMIPYLYPDQYFDTDAVRKAYFERIETLKQADLFLTNSEYTARELIETLGIDPTRVVNASAGVGSEFHPRDMQQGEKSRLLGRFGLRDKFILYAGGADARKNIEGLLKAYALLSRELREKHQLVLVSKMPDAIEQRLREMASELGIADNVRIIAYVTDADLIGLYNLCGVSILPSFHEGFGLPLLEAMACGAPVIGSNRTSMPEVLGRKHATFNPDDSEEMSSKLAQVLVDPTFAAQLRREGLEQARVFTWARSSSIALDAMEEMVERSGHLSKRGGRTYPGTKQRVALVLSMSVAMSARLQALVEDLSTDFSITLVSLTPLAGIKFGDDPSWLSPEAFDERVGDFDRLLYVIGTDANDRWILRLAERYSGIVALESVFIGRHYAADGADCAIEALYVSHGYRPLLLLKEGIDLDALNERFPCALSLLRNSECVLVSSASEMEVIAACYRHSAEEYASYVQHVPFVEGIPEPEAVRALLLNLPYADGRSDALAVGRQLARLESGPAPDRVDLIEVSECVASNITRRLGDAQIFVDITELMAGDSKSGIQRVVRAILAELLHREIKGYRVEPVYRDGETYRYACSGAVRLLEIPIAPASLEDAPIEPRFGDVFLRLDLILLGNDIQLQHMRDVGVSVFEVVYDLLPVKWPEHFIPEMPPVFQRWLDETSWYADGVICISKAVADEFSSWMDGWQPARPRPLKIGFFHLGADLEKSLPSRGVSGDVKALLASDRSNVFLMVGTVEARKAYAQVLDAFEELWAAGEPATLVIVGKHGWLVEGLVARLRSHPELGNSLFWLNAISDEALLKLYARADALIMASEAEGFGLPLIEAARHGLPLIVRDLPVFREVARDGAYYFSGESGDALASALRQWMALHERGEAPQSSGVEILDWRQSVDQLLEVILGNNWYREWEPGKRQLFTPAREMLNTEVGRIRGHRIWTTGQGGLLVASRAMHLRAGSHEIRLRADIAEGVRERSFWYEFVADGRVLSRHWPLESQRTGPHGEFVDRISLDHEYDALKFRLWVAEEADLVFHSVEILPLTEQTSLATAESRA